MSGRAIVAKQLRHSFKDVVALDGLSLEVEAGTVFGLLGPNGAGKTTFVRVLATLLRPDSGRAFVLGHDVVDEPLAVRRRIGLAGQFAAVDEELTGRENLEMIGRLYRLSTRDAKARADEVLHLFGLEDAAERRVSTYSGGMRRRLDLAASLTGRPPVMLLDEPTTGLDPRSRQALWNTVDELRRDGTTVLLTTQYLEEADRLAQRIAVIDHGHVVAQGTARELKADIGSEMLVLQLADPSRASLAAASICDLAANEQPVVDSSAGEVRLAVAGSEASAKAIRRLDAQGVAVAAIELQQPSLDDVYLSLTGRHLEAESESNDQIPQLEAS